MEMGITLYSLCSMFSALQYTPYSLCFAVLSACIALYSL